MLRDIHMTHLKEQNRFVEAGDLITKAFNKGIGVNLTDYKSRIHFSYYKMGYSESDGCKP